MHSQPITLDWRKIPSFPDYEINELGEVRRTYLVRGVTPRTDYLPPLTKYADTADPKILLRYPGTRKPSKQSQAGLLAEAFIGPRPSVAHSARFKDGNPKNTIVENVEWIAPEGWTPDDGLEWRLIPGFEDYEVREDGLIRRAKAARNSKRQPLAWSYKPGQDLIGPQVIIRKHDGVSVRLPVREAVASAYLGATPSVFYGLIFIDGNCENLRWSNLSWELVSGRKLANNGMEWRPIAGHPEYEIREDGLIRRLTPDYFGNNAGMVIRPYIPREESKAYKIVTLADANRQTRAYTVHFLVATTFIGPKPSPELEVAHWDGIKLNNHYSNLRWATSQENANDRMRHGTVPMGEDSGTSKLTEAQVLEIRRLRGIESPGSLAARLDVDVSCIHKIWSGKTWKHLTSAA